VRQERGLQIHLLKELLFLVDKDKVTWGSHAPASRESPIARVPALHPHWLIQLWFGWHLLVVVVILGLWLAETSRILLKAVIPGSAHLALIFSVLCGTLDGNSPPC
jgi:hypothetical protein